MDFNSSRDVTGEFVDAFGQDIPVTTLPETGEKVVELTNLKPKGFGIYERSQYTKLTGIGATQKDFNEKFHSYMLKSAQRYMTENQHVFNPEVILNAIAKCERLLCSKSESLRGIPINGRQIESNIVENMHKSNQFEASVRLAEVHEIKREQDTSSYMEDSSFSQFLHSNVSTQFETTVRNEGVSKIKKTEPVSNSLKFSPHLNISSDSLRKSFEAYVSMEGDKNVEKASGVSNLVPNTSYTKGAPKSKLSPESQSHLKNIVQRKSNVGIYEKKRLRYDAVVTCIYKKNCIWVRDKRNDDLFTKVFNIANDEARQKSQALKPLSAEKMYLARDEDYWFRCTIRKFVPLTVFFIDYGNITEVDEVREASKELSAFPYLAVPATFKESQYAPIIEDEIQIEIIRQNQDGTYFVNVIQKPVQQESFREPNQYHKPPSLSRLQDGLKVNVIFEENSVIYLRCFDSFNKLNDIETTISEKLKDLKPIKNVTIGQIVLCQEPKSRRFYRAIITRIVSPNEVKVEFLDYVKEITVDTMCLRQILDELKYEPVTYIQGIKLNGFENKKIDEIGQQIIKKAIHLRKPYRITLNSNGAFDLVNGTSSLSEELHNHGRITLAEMKPFQPELGMKSYMCGSYDNSSNFFLVATDMLKKHQEEIYQCVESSERYIPLINEVCLCRVEEDWCRCVITRLIGEDFEGLLLDFGESIVVSPDRIRKPTASITKIPPLGICCKFINLVIDDKKEQFLKRNIRAGEIYNVNIKTIQNGRCGIEIPVIYNKIPN